MNAHVCHSITLTKTQMRWRYRICSHMRERERERGGESVWTQIHISYRLART